MPVARIDHSSFRKDTKDIPVERVLSSEDIDANVGSLPRDYVRFWNIETGLMYQLPTSEAERLRNDPKISFTPITVARKTLECEVCGLKIAPPNLVRVPEGREDMEQLMLEQGWLDHFLAFHRRELPAFVIDKSPLVQRMAETALLRG